MTERRSPKNTVTLDELRAELTEPDDSMTYERYREIAQLDKEGQLESIPKEQLSEYLEFKASMSALIETIYSSATKNIASQFQSPSFPFGRPPIALDDRELDEDPSTNEGKLGMPGTEIAALADPNQAIQRLLEDIAGLMTEQNRHHVKNADYLKVMTNTLVETKAARESADHRADAQAKVNTALTWAAVVLAAVSSISIFPVLIEFWRYLNAR